MNQRGIILALVILAIFLFISLFFGYQKLTRINKLQDEILTPFQSNLTDEQKITDLNYLVKVIAAAKEGSKLSGKSFYCHVDTHFSCLGYSNQYDLQIDGTGWVPIDLTKQDRYKIQTLPRGPETEDHPQSYRYCGDGKGYLISALLSSQKLANKIIKAPSEPYQDKDKYYYYYVAGSYSLEEAAQKYESYFGEPGCLYGSYQPKHLQSTESIRSETDDWPIYTNNEAGYKLKYPTSWKVYSFKNYPYDGFPGILNEQSIIITSSQKFPKMDSEASDKYIGVEIYPTTEDLSKKLKSVYIERSDGVNIYKEIRNDNLDSDIYNISSKDKTRIIKIILSPATVKEEDKYIVSQMLKAFEFLNKGR